MKRQQEDKESHHEKTFKVGVRSSSGYQRSFGLGRGFSQVNLMIFCWLWPVKSTLLPKKLVSRDCTQWRRCSRRSPVMIWWEQRAKVFPVQLLHQRSMASASMLTPQVLYMYNLLWYKRSPLMWFGFPESRDRQRWTVSFLLVFGDLGVVHKTWQI
jgi:hypothetical protein